jgi:hypothetical protein
VHAGSNVAIQPWVAIPGAEDNVDDDFAEGLGHCGIMAEKQAEVNRAFSAGNSFLPINPGALPQAGMTSRRWR